MIASLLATEQAESVNEVLTHPVTIILLTAAVGLLVTWSWRTLDERKKYRELVETTNAKVDGLVSDVHDIRTDLKDHMKDEERREHESHEAFERVVNRLHDRIDDMPQRRRRWRS